MFAWYVNFVISGVFSIFFDPYLIALYFSGSAKLRAVKKDGPNKVLNILYQVYMYWFTVFAITEQVDVKCIQC